MLRIVLSMLVLLIMCISVEAAEVLFDFESPDDFEGWRLRTPAQDTWEPSPLFASRGTRSARFETPKWEEGMQQWPAMDVVPPVSDWSAYDRLVFDVVNPTNGIVALNLFITDSSTPMREGGRVNFTIQGRSYERLIVDLTAFPSQVRRDDIILIHWFMTRPGHAYVWHVDNVTLLEADEPLPELPADFIQQVTALMLEDERIEGALARIREAAEEVADSGLPAVATQWAAAEFGALEARWNALQERISTKDLTLDEAEDLRNQFESLFLQVERTVSLASVRADAVAAGHDLPYAVCVASSMEKVLPRDMPVTAQVQAGVSLDLARNERESVQIVVIPFEKDLSGVRVSITSLEGTAGSVLPREALDVEVVGYVKTDITPYEVPYTGWWPDPLLDFIEAPDIARGDAQAFWIRVNCPREQAPGVYTGQLDVAPANADGFALPFKVRVRDFEMPDASPLPTATSVYDQFIRQVVSADWDELKWDVADFLADYYLDYDSLYRRTEPDWDILKKLDDEGRLVAFNLRYFYQADFSPALDEAEFARRLEALKQDVAQIYARARELGISDKAYIYGFDECSSEYFGVLQRIAQGLKEVIPDVPIMTTTYDHSYGLDSGITDIDVWVPLTPEYRPERVEEARALGRQVWWYICVAPRHPYANWFIEHPAIEARLLMGAMTAKYRPDGFLYYALSRWPNNDRPITEGPFTNWNPASFRDYNGDGSLFCPGPDGRPLPTIRLENFRDGIEDYAYVKVLEERLAARRDAWQAPTEIQRRALEVAEQALDVPEELVRSMSEYSRDPRLLYEYRERLADAIEALGE